MIGYFRVLTHLATPDTYRTEKSQTWQRSNHYGLGKETTFLSDTWHDAIQTNKWDVNEVSRERNIKWWQCVSAAPLFSSNGEEPKALNKCLAMASYESRIPTWPAPKKLPAEIVRSWKGWAVENESEHLVRDWETQSNSCRIQEPIQKNLLYISWRRKGRV